MSYDVGNDKYTGGIGFCGLLAILFVALKLTGVISWSWLWVLSPLWIPAAFALCTWIVILVVAKIKDKLEE